MAETSVPRKTQPASTLGRLSFAPAVVEKPKPQKPKREKVKGDPAHVAAARELRDRWLERVNAPGEASSLLSNGKYKVSKSLEAPPVEVIATIAALPAPVAG